MIRENPETQFKHFLVGEGKKPGVFKGFFSRIEPGRGGDFGFPDLVLGTAIGLVPAELKIGSIEDNTLWTSNIRPSQLAFARNISEAGFPSIFLVGIQSGSSWRVFVFNAVLAPQYDTTGFKIGVDCFELPCHDLASEIDEFLFREFGE